jgi:hypothetical protein
MFRTWLDPPIPNACSPAVAAVQDGEDLRKAQIIAPSVTAVHQTEKMGAGALRPLRRTVPPDD